MRNLEAEANLTLPEAVARQRAAVESLVAALNTVPGSTGNLFQQWQAADRGARELEQAVGPACLDGNALGEFPSLQQRAYAQRLRHTADNLFALAILSEMKRRAGKTGTPDPAHVTRTMP